MENGQSQIVLDTLRDLLVELGGRTEGLSLTSDLERDLGLGSLERVELIVRLERKLQVKLPDAATMNAGTPALLLEALSAAHGRVARRKPMPAPRDAGSEARQVAGAPARWGVPDSIGTLVDMARHHAETQGDRTHLFLPEADGRERRLSFGALWSAGLRTAGGLARRGVTPGARVAIILPTGPDFYTTFLGVLCAGCVPVPLYPPARMNDLPGYVERGSRILASARPEVLVTDGEILPAARLLADRRPGLITVTAEALAAEEGQAVARVAPDDLALIQYSSGSTGDPKGVALTHRSLIANMRAIGLGLSFGPNDIPISWLPLYHDMGLIGTWLSPYLHGMQVVMISPLQFLSRPERWLWAFHRYRGTISPAPNFGYELCCRKIEDADIVGLDLSSWRSAMNGSEPVRADTVERFCRRFAPHGFKREAMMPVYGLAETCVALTFPAPGRGARFDRIDAAVLAREGRAEPALDGTLEIAACGRPLAGHEVRIAGDRGEPCCDRVQGRILFRGPSTMAGYFDRPDATAAVRYALPGDDRAGPWIDTGDLGYLADGELHVTGRAKDLIIKGGRKYHPQDIEDALKAVEGLRKGCAVAFDVRTGSGRDSPADGFSGEAIVVLAESREPPARHAELAAAITAAVQRQIGTPPDRVQILRPGSLPKTSSGKLRRRESRKLYLEGGFTARPARLRGVARLAVGSAVRRAVASLRRAGGTLFGAYATATAAATLVPGLAGVSAFCRTPEATWREGRRVLRVATTLSGLPVRRRGPAIPERGAILVSNHASYIDWLVLMLALEQPVLFTAKSSVFALPVAGAVLRRLGHIEVERSLVATRLESYQAALSAVQQGRLVHFFPESTFTAASGLRPFRLGAFRLAAEAAVPIIPVAILGTRRALRDERWMLRRSRLEVRVLPAIAPPPQDLREIARVRDTVREQLGQAVGEPLLDIVTAALPTASGAAPGQGS